VALNFPNSPGIGSVFTDSTSGFSYEWNGTVWKSFSSATASNIQVLDDINGSFNGVTLTFALTSGGTAVSPVNAQQLDINLGGVIQAPGTDYTVSGSNITFTGPAPTAGLTFSGKLLGGALPLNTIADGTVTPTKLSAGGPSWNSGGDLYVTGVGTFGNLRVTGVATATTFSGNLSGNATGLSGTPNITVGNITSGNINSSGVVTATSFKGDGSQLSGVGLELKTAGVSAGTGITSINFSGAVVSTSSAGVSTVTISGISSTGISTAAIWSNPSVILTSIGLTQGNNNYGAFGPITVSVGATVTVGVANTWIIV